MMVPKSKKSKRPPHPRARKPKKATEAESATQKRAIEACTDIAKAHELAACRARSIINVLKVFVSAGHKLPEPERDLLANEMISLMHIHRHHLDLNAHLPAISEALAAPRPAWAEKAMEVANDAE